MPDTPAVPATTHYPDTSGPDFLIIGAMKSGTSTLAAQLGAQDGIFLTTPKEPNFFSDEDVWARGSGWYRDLFSDAAPGDLRGEASTHYTKLPTYPRTLERMRSLIATPRLVYLIRDPVERAVSHYIHEWSTGEMQGDIAAAFGGDARFVDYGRYGMQIAPFVEAYGHEAICLSSLEMLTADPVGELARIARFIGFDGPVSWQSGRARENASATRFRRLPMHGLLVDNPVATALRRRLVPKSIRRWVRERRSIGARPALPDDLRARLEAVFTEDRETLAAMFPAHPALEAAYPFLAPRQRAAG